VVKGLEEKEGKMLHKSRVARFFLVRDTKTGKMYQMVIKFSKMSLKYSKCP
jgi:hypothetical protein